MRVGLNLVFLVPGETGGMEVYARELIAALGGRAELTAFVGEEARGWSGLDEVVVPVRASRRTDWVRGEQQHLPRLAAGMDLVHSLASTGPARGSFRRVTTVHDLIYKVHPEAHFGVRSLGMRVLVPLAVRRSHRLIAVSNSTRDDLVRHLKVDPLKIDVVHNGLGSPPRPEIALPGEELRARHRLGTRPLVLCPSAKRPHKNLAALLRAIARIPAERRPVTLVAGYRTPHEAELQALAVELGVEGDVRFTGWLPDDELEGLYALATCLVFPSLYEGFGLPVLEAMARGVPVACSDRSSLPELAEGAALLFDPEDDAAIAAAVERLLGDEGERERLRAAGRERAARFTWEAAAEGTLASYERALA